MFWVQRVPPVDSVGLLRSPAAAWRVRRWDWIPVCLLGKAHLQFLLLKEGHGDLDLGAPYCLEINGGLKRAGHWAYRRGPAPWVPSGAGVLMMFRFLRSFLGTLYEVQAGDTAQPSVVSSQIPVNSFCVLQFLWAWGPWVIQTSLLTGLSAKTRSACLFFFLQFFILLLQYCVYFAIH